MAKAMIPHTTQCTTPANDGQRERASHVGELYRTHYDWMLRVATRILSDTHAAQDCVQEVARKLLSSRKRLPEISKPYLFTALSRECFRELDYSKRLSNIVDAHLPEELIQRTHLSPSSLARGERQAELDESIRNHAARLPERTKRVVLLRAGGLTYADIASEVGISLKTVSWHLERAKLLRRTRERAKERDSNQESPPSAQ